MLNNLNKKYLIKLKIIFIVFVLSLSGCNTLETQGAAGGAVVGGIIGQILGGNREATMLGAVIGAGIGAAIGSHYSKRRNKYSTLSKMLDSETTYASQQLNSLQRQNRSLKRLIAQQKVEINSLKRAVNNGQADRNTLNRNKNQLITAEKKAKEQLKKVNVEINIQKELLVNAKKENSIKKARIAKLEQIVAGLVSEKSILESSIGDMSALITTASI